MMMMEIEACLIWDKKATKPLTTAEFHYSGSFIRLRENSRTSGFQTLDKKDFVIELIVSN
jgi:hypothetical protein